MTGSPTPTAADAIVPFEATAGGLANSLDVIHVLEAPAPGRSSVAAAPTSAPATSSSRRVSGWVRSRWLPPWPREPTK